MLWKGFQRPKRVEVDTETLTATYGRFTAQPFERGFATTIGNALPGNGQATVALASRITSTTL